MRMQDAGRASDMGSKRPNRVRAMPTAHRAKLDKNARLICSDQ